MEVILELIQSLSFCKYPIKAALLQPTAIAATKRIQRRRFIQLMFIARQAEVCQRCPTILPTGMMLPKRNRQFV
jgi:hypothetical protein